MDRYVSRASAGTAAAIAVTISRMAATAAKRRRVGGCDLEEQPLHQPSQPDGTDEAGHQPSGRKRQRPPHHLPAHRSGRRAERELDSDFARAAHHAESHDTIQTDGGKQHRDRCKRRDHDGAEAGIRRRLRSECGHRPGARHRQPWVYRLHRGTHGGDQGHRIARRPDVHVHPQERCLRERRVHDRDAAHRPDPGTARRARPRQSSASRRSSRDSPAAGGGRWHFHPGRSGGRASPTRRRPTARPLHRRPRTRVPRPPACRARGSRRGTRQ